MWHVLRKNGGVLRLRKMLFEFEKLEILPPNCRVHQPKLRVYHQKAPKLGINIYIDNKSEAVRGDKKNIEQEA
jgi:hypothetical protein